MNTKTSTLTIETINTRPVIDPYHMDTGKASMTTLKLDPDQQVIWVMQEYDDNSTPSDEWHGLVQTWHVYDHPFESTLRAWLEDNLEAFQFICDGFERVWNGSNHVGRLTDEAREAVEILQQELSHGFPEGYQFWDTTEYLYEAYASRITSDTTDAELEAMAADAEADAELDNVVLSESALKWMRRQWRQTE